MLWFGSEKNFRILCFSTLHYVWALLAMLPGFGDILPETSKSSAFWDMGVDSHLKWLLLFSPDEACESDGTSLLEPLAI